MSTIEAAAGRLALHLTSGEFKFLLGFIAGFIACFAIEHRK